MAKEMPRILWQPSLSVLMDLYDQISLTSFCPKLGDYLF